MVGIPPQTRVIPQKFQQNDNSAYSAILYFFSFRYCGASSQFRSELARWGQRTKRINVYAKCKNLTDINIKCTMILAKVLAMKSG